MRFFKRRGAHEQSTTTEGLAGREEIFAELDRVVNMAGESWKGTVTCSACGAYDEVVTVDRARFSPGGPKAFCRNCKAPVTYVWDEA